MSVRLDKYSYNQIVNHACGDKTLQLRTEDIHDDTGFIKLVPNSKIQTVIQKEISLYCNLLYKIEFIFDYTHHLDPN
jgi:expansin (peptidoglycan-binding protein)